MSPILFNKKLELALKQRGITQTQLASRSKISGAAISRYLTGDRLPNVVSIIAIAKALNIDGNEILSWFKDGTPNLKRENLVERLLGLFAEMNEYEQADHVDALELRLSKRSNKKMIKER